MSKVEMKTYFEPDLAKQILDTHKQFCSAGRKVSRAELIEQLVKDGFRLWRKEQQVMTTVETTMAHLLDHAERQDRILRSILLTLADGDEGEVAKVMQTIEGERHNA